MDELSRRGEEEAGIYYSRSGWQSDELKSESDAYSELGQAFSAFGALNAGNEKRSLELRHQGSSFESEAEGLAEDAAKADPYAHYDDGGEAEDNQEPSSASSNTELLRIFEDL